MRVVFFTRPWSLEMDLALEQHWQARGTLEEARYVTHHLQAAKMLAAAGRESILLPEAIKQVEFADPYAELKRIEDAYGEHLLPLQRYLMAERYFARRRSAWQVDQLVRHALVFEHLFADLRPDLLIGPVPDLFSGWLANDLAIAFGCEPAGVSPSTIPGGRMLILRRHDEVRGARERYAELRARDLRPAEREAAQALQGIVTGTGTQIDYEQGRQEPKQVAKRIVTGAAPRNLIGKSIWELRERLAGNWYVQPDPILYELAAPFRALRAGIADSRLFTDGPPERPYVLFPLNYEPEAALLIHGSYFEDQMVCIRNLARSLPAGWELVVKEHPTMQRRGRRPFGFYRRLHRIPNVRLVPGKTSNARLVNGAEAVALVSGTSGLEASLVGKPVVMFGDFPWDYAPTVHKVERLADLPRVLAEATSSPLGGDDPAVLAFAASWDASLPRGRYYTYRGSSWLDPDNVADIAAALESLVTPTNRTGSSSPILVAQG